MLAKNDHAVDLDHRGARFAGEPRSNELGLLEPSLLAKNDDAVNLDHRGA
ncbi:hypothetical protein [Pseudomonas syringae]|nr:hypothetical protein [Pseudomonas syringae]